MRSCYVFPSVVACALGAGALSIEPGTFEIDLLFPQNASYSLQPGDRFPLVWAVRNAELSPLLNVLLTFRFGHLETYDKDGTASQGDDRLAFPNATDHTQYRYYERTDITKEGEYFLAWDIYGTDCDSKSLTNSTDDGPVRMRQLIHFTVHKDAPAPNLLDAARNCTGRQGTAVGVASFEDDKRVFHKQCAVLDKIDPFPQADLCGLKVNETTIANMTKTHDAAFTEHACSFATPTISCPAKNGSSRTVVGGLLWLSFIGLFFG